MNNFIRLLSVKMWNYQVPGGACLKKSVHQRMLVEQDLQLCSTLVSGVLASSYTAPHSLQSTPLECTMTLYNIATHPFNAHHPMRHNFAQSCTKFCCQATYQCRLRLCNSVKWNPVVRFQSKMPRCIAPGWHNLRGVLKSWLDPEFGPQNAYVEILATFATKMP